MSGDKEMVEGAEVGHVCEESPTGRKPTLCWICGELLPHDCVGEQLSKAAPATSAFYEYCAAHDIDVCNGASQHAFETGWGYRAKVGDGQDSVTHGLPQGSQSTAANSFASSAATIAPTASKWPIGTPADDHYNLAWGFRLQQARAHRGLTLDALGAKLNPPRTRKDISAMEHGRRGLSVELCAELAQALDCDRCWLAGWKEGTR